MQRRIVYIIVIVITIATGLFVRLKQQWFPDIVNLYLGDILYAFMMFYIVSFVAKKYLITKRAIIALSVCLVIEVLQLYQAEWINAIRQTLPGKLILGSGFLWTDLLAYTIGVLAAYVFEKFMLSKHNSAH
jgi:hypothetical protein